MKETKLTQLVMNKLSEAQYRSMSPEDINANELYLTTDSYESSIVVVKDSSKIVYGKYEGHDIIGVLLDVDIELSPGTFLIFNSPTNINTNDLYLNLRYLNTGLDKELTLKFLSGEYEILHTDDVLIVYIDEEDKSYIVSVSHRGGKISASNIYEDTIGSETPGAIHPFRLLAGELGGPFYINRVASEVTQPPSESVLRNSKLLPLSSKEIPPVGEIYWKYNG